MLGSIKDFKYKKVKNFLSPEETNLLCSWVEDYHKNNLHKDGVDMIQSNVYNTMGDYKPIFEKLLETKRKKMEEECGLSLYPTYSFFRMYTLYSDLKKHTDRPSCEISATVCLGGDKTEWPIYIEGNAVSLDPGDAVIYLGCDLQHWREKFLGDWQAQCFLHWVDANGKYKHHKNDNVLKTTGKQR
jgi:hypothetical protein